MLQVVVRIAWSGLCPSLIGKQQSCYYEYISFCFHPVHSSQHCCPAEVL